jgi:hypothetical protein
MDLNDITTHNPDSFVHIIFFRADGFGTSRFGMLQFLSKFKNKTRVFLIVWNAVNQPIIRSSTASFAKNNMN